ncbi:MAG: hypothetical protein JNJ95_01040 [Dechloromonas sp.]|nr:hypothetical protein [Dechloromonas sp.]
MALRLEQLRTAQGHTEAPPIVAREVSHPVATIDSARSFRTGVLFSTAVISALCGAALMWLATPSMPPSHPVAPAALSVQTPAPAQPAANVPALGSTELNEKTQIGELLEDWRKAWAYRDIPGYLKTYGQQFSPADGKPRDSWVAARTKKLSTGAPIELQIRELGIERVNADQFRATFLQDYASGNYREMARTKTLMIAREHGEWKIIREWVAENKLAAN